MANIEESFAAVERDVQALKDKTKMTSQKVKDLEESVEFSYIHFQC